MSTAEGRGQRPPRLRFGAPVLAALLLACTRPPPFERGEQAYLAGDFARAMAELRPLAEHGHPRAEYYVGRMLERGEGMKADPAAAVRWYRAAAVEGTVAAQIALAELYREGRGVPRDPVEAHAWLTMAADLGEVTAESARVALGARLSPAERDEARRRFERLLDALESPPPPAARPRTPGRDATP